MPFGQTNRYFNSVFVFNSISISIPCYSQFVVCYSFFDLEADEFNELIRMRLGNRVKGEYWSDCGSVSGRLKTC